MSNLIPKGNDENLENVHGDQSEPSVSFGDLLTDKSSQQPFFQMRKSEFEHEKPDAGKSQWKPMIDNFLKNTPVDEEAGLSSMEKQALINTRKALTDSTNAEDSVLHAIHLARLYQHLRYIDEARQATLLSLGIDPDHIQGRELFKELERMHPPDLAVSAQGVSALSKSKLRQRIKNLSGGQVIVLGDLLIDELVEGKAERISREAPVLILEHVQTELIPGGAANTANNVAALGGKCHAVGICGSDDYAQKLKDLFNQRGITHSLVADESRPTTVKTRILSKSHSFKQQLLRLDRISHEEISETIESKVIEKIMQLSGEYKAMVLSDYRSGLMTNNVIKACRQVAKEKNMLVIVDAQDHFERFQDITLITPNQPDAEKVVGFTIDSKEKLKDAGKQLMLITGSQAVLITRGAEGMVLFQKGQEMVELPAFNRSEVFDVSGAGDTVAATIALALVTGCSFVEAMALGNLAASIVVKKPGTAVTSQKEMLADLDKANLPED